MDNDEELLTESTTEIPDSGDGTGMFAPWPEEALRHYHGRTVTEEEADRVRQAKSAAYDWVIASVEEFYAAYPDGYIAPAEFLTAVLGVHEQIEKALNDAAARNEQLRAEAEQRRREATQEPQKRKPWPWEPVLGSAARKKDSSE